MEKEKGCAPGLIIAVITVCCLFILSPFANAKDEDVSDWTSFMKDQSHSSVSDESLATPLSLKWKFDTKGPVYASPVVSEGLVFIGSFDKNFYAIDLETGKKRWQFATKGEISGSANVENGVVYFGSKDGFLYALSAKNGKLIWKYKAGGKVTSSPVVGRKYVYIGSKNVLLTAVDKKRGRKKWRKTLVRDRFSGGYSNPFFQDGLLVVASKLGEVFAFNEKGRKQWAFSVPSAVYSSPVLRDNTLYLGAYDRFVYSLNVMDNEIQPNWRKDLGAPVYGSPFVQNGVFVGTTKGILYSLDEEDGSELWKLNLNKPLFSTLAVTSDNLGFLGCEDGNIYAVDLDEGMVVWSYSTGGGIHSSPAIVTGNLLFGSKDGSVYALHPQGEEN
ncbi:MAG: PQQ-binding-like beta-propeller repeat protein [Nitrospinota bacterium]